MAVRRIILKFCLTNAIILVILSASFNTYQSSHPLADFWSSAAHLPADSHMVNYWEQSHPSKQSYES